jgi:ferrous iron transport protein B
MKPETIAITGNPNCGKSTIFNILTGSRQTTGNWPGVTVEKREGSMKYRGRDYNIVDLPGIYSLSAFSDDERVSRDYLLSGEADLVINIIDAANIQRNLYLTVQLLEMGLPVVVILNRIDIAEKMKIRIDTDLMSAQLGCPVINISALRKGDDLKLKEAIYNNTNYSFTPVKVDFPNEIADIMESWKPSLQSMSEKINAPSDWIALKILEKDPLLTAQAINSGLITQDEIDTAEKNIETILHEASDIIIADYRYGFIQGITRRCVIKQSDPREITDMIDSVALNRFAGLPLFLSIMYLTFKLTLSFSAAFIDFFNGITGAIFIDGLAALLSAIHAPHWLITVLASGAGAGIQAVASFIPIVFAMFFMLSVLEDSGYMSRAAFVMDRLMRIMGLPGKSFLPLMIGFGCTVPAVMAARTLEEKRDRIMTVFMSPFMSCGARLSVYALFTVAFFSSNPGAVVFSLYGAGVLLAVMTGFLLKKTVYPSEPSNYVLELPIYNLPRMKHILIHTWTRLKAFISGAGKIIVVAVMILSFFNSLGTDGTFGNENTDRSLLTKAGKSTMPLFSPMGITDENWPAAVAIFSGPFAKEAIAGTLNSLYGQMNAEPENIDESIDAMTKITSGIKNAFLSVPANLKTEFARFFPTPEISADTDEEEGSLFIENMRRYFPGKAGAYAYLLFIMIYFPCIATVGTVYKEAGAGVAVAQVLYMTVLAWIVSVLFYQFAAGGDFFWISAAIALFIIVIALFYAAGRIINSKVDPKL